MSENCLDLSTLGIVHRNPYTSPLTSHPAGCTVTPARKVVRRLEQHTVMRNLAALS